MAGKFHESAGFGIKTEIFRMLTRFPNPEICAMVGRRKMLVGALVKSGVSDNNFKRWGGRLPER